MTRTIIPLQTFKVHDGSLVQDALGLLFPNLQSNAVDSLYQFHDLDVVQARPTGEQVHGDVKHMIGCDTAA